MKEFVAYYRVSTPRQGKSGLGLEAQQEKVRMFKMETGYVLVKEFTEVESGAKNNRRKLQKALRYCKKRPCALVIPNVDRLARDALFTASLLNARVEIIPTDKPNADHLDILEDAIDAEKERRKISKRTRDALQSAKRRGIELGKNGKALARDNKRKADAFAANMISVIELLRSEGYTSEVLLTKQFNRRKILPFRGAGYKWHKSTTHTLLKRIERLNADPS